MRVQTSNQLSARLMVIFASLFLMPIFGRTQTQIVPTDPAEGLAMQLWTTDRATAVIYVESTVINKKGPENVSGTAFMLSDEYALTAAHVVCNEDNSPSTQITFHIGGQGAPSITPGSPLCFSPQMDAALIRVPTIAGGRKHLDPGAPESIVADPFVTSYGFGGNVPGRFLKGNARLPADADNRIRTDLGAAPGDSGAPVVDRSGRAIGVLIAGNTIGTTGFISLRQLSANLGAVGILLPVLQPQPSYGNSNLTGTLMLQLGRSADGTWPTPRTRPASTGEAQITVNYEPGTRPYITNTQDGGAWSAQLPVGLDTKGIQYSAVPVLATEVDTPIENRSFWADPYFDKVSTSDIGQPRALMLYARSAYVAYELGIAASEEQVVQASPYWTDCRSVLMTGNTSEAASCTPQVMRGIQKQISEADGAYHRAFAASAAGEDDINITTQIAAQWANFRFSAGNACRAAQVMQSLISQFTTDDLTAPLIAQTLDQVVGCQQMPENAAGAMTWRMAGESRQAASVRLIRQTLSRFAQSPIHLQGQRGRVISNVVTALEAYQPGPITTSQAAKVIEGDPMLSQFLNSFYSDYAVPLCGSKKSAGEHKDLTVSKKLNQLITLARACA